ncbi:MAG TPA: hypothetical protein VGB24_00140 [Longimicrobium sp.]|jgi:ElaB/YqjD/DUF883 family membrane-anchored ribosome-binding protein|uniref:hypothetical protein n=1 Tax=Longimicrobium sp. TaxID=2029185 RepID=UPI002EDA3F9A
MNYSALLPRRAAAAGLLFLAAACGGDEPGEMTAKPSDVDQTTSITPTEKEVASFQAPADSVLTPRQVEAYLKASLLQYDLIRDEAPGLRKQALAMEQREQKGGVMNGLRNVAAAGSLINDYSQLIVDSYPRASRTLGYNPAEMEWVRERMGEVSAYIMTKPMLESMVQQAQTMRQSAESYRGQPGFSDEQIAEMIRNADDMERQAKEQMQTGGSAVRNFQVLRQARPNVTDEMWMTVSFAGASGLMMLPASMTSDSDTTAQRQLNEWRQVYTDALANRVTPGMEPEKPEAQSTAGES